MTKSTISRGMRNNNPFNIRRNKNNHWVGMAKEQTDKSFVVFEAMEYGCRAMWKILYSYRLRAKIRGDPFTLEYLINQFAPSTENPTRSYMSFICKHAGVMKDEVLPDPEQMPYRYYDILYSMAAYENGLTYTEAKRKLESSIRKGAQLAFN